MLRILSGLMLPTTGSVSVCGVDTAAASRALRQRIGLMPSGDRTFYLRISGLENLVFFGRLHGLRRREALARAREVLADVELTEAANVRVGFYSHGMQKRLGVARALLTRPDVLLVDEATHDLDPEGAERVRELVRALCQRGTAVVWTTQRIDEVRGFAERATVLVNGEVAFAGTVPGLMALTIPRRYVVRLRNGATPPSRVREVVSAALRGRATVEDIHGADDDHYVIALADDVVLGDALATLAEARVDVLTCREERSEIEQAFLELTKRP